MFSCVPLSSYSTIPISGTYILLYGICCGFNCHLPMNRTLRLSGGKNAFQHQHEFHAIRARTPSSPAALGLSSSLICTRYSSIFPISDYLPPLHLLVSPLCKSGGYLMIYFPSNPIFRVMWAIGYKLSMWKYSKWSIEHRKKNDTTSSSLCSSCRNR